MDMVRTTLFLSALLIGCASASSPVRPAVSITQTSTAEPVQTATRVSTEIASPVTVPVDYRLDIANPFDHPITLTSVEIESVGGSGAYALKRVKHAFDRVVAAKSSDSLELRAWVQPLQLTNSGQVDSPVMIRGTAHFDSQGTTVRTSFVARFRR